MDIHRLTIPCSWGDIVIFTTCEGRAVCEVYFDNRRPGTVHYNRLAVAENVRNCGIGTLLISYAHEYALCRGCKHETLAVDVNNRCLIEWYERLGFCEYRRDEFEIFMERTV